MYYLIKQLFKKRQKQVNTCYMVAIATNVQQSELVVSLETFPFATKPTRQKSAPNSCNRILYREIFTDKIHALEYKKELQDMSLEELVSYLEYHNVDWDSQTQ